MKQLNLIKKRKSIRAYKNDIVSEKDIQTLLEAARWAPSAGNKQPVEIVIVKSVEQKEKLVEGAYGQKFIGQVPVVFVVCADLDRSSVRYGERGANLYAIQDAAAATQNILLMATDLNYGTVWVGAFDEKVVSLILKLPANVRPLAIIPIGRPAQDPSPRPRREIDEFVHHEVF
ncbi:MAG: nitroreductase family protein [Candidatus Hodarchaeales archaeon]|jgi:nitroreductase